MLFPSTKYRELVLPSGLASLCAAPLALCAFCTLFIVLTVVSMGWSKDTKNIRIVGFDYSPFYQEDAGAIKGIAVELAHELFSRLEMQPEVTVFPLKRVLDKLRNGQADATMILIKTPERATFLEFTQPVVTVRGLMWSLADRKGGSIQFDDLRELKQYRIGLTRGYSYGPEFDQILETMDTDTANSDYANFLKLLQRRIDVFPCNEIVAQGLFKEYPELQGKFTPSQKAFMEWDLRIAISRKSQYVQMLPAINAALSELKYDGIIDHIVCKYIQ